MLCGVFFNHIGVAVGKWGRGGEFKWCEIWVFLYGHVTYHVNLRTLFLLPFPSLSVHSG